MRLAKPATDAVPVPHLPHKSSATTSTERARNFEMMSSASCTNCLHTYPRHCHLKEALGPLEETRLLRCRTEPRASSVEGKDVLRGEESHKNRSQRPAATTSLVALRQPWKTGMSRKDLALYVAQNERTRPQLGPHRPREIGDQGVAEKRVPYHVWR